jgi:hypothetical protein
MITTTNLSAGPGEPHSQSFDLNKGGPDLVA